MPSFRNRAAPGHSQPQLWSVSWSRGSPPAAAAPSPSSRRTASRRTTHRRGPDENANEQSAPQPLRCRDGLVQVHVQVQAPGEQHSPPGHDARSPASVPVSGREAPAREVSSGPRDPGLRGSCDRRSSHSSGADDASDLLFSTGPPSPDATLLIEVVAKPLCATPATPSETAVCPGVSMKTPCFSFPNP